MRLLLAAVPMLAFAFLSPAFAADDAMDKTGSMGTMDCTDAGMKKMNTQIEGMSGDSKKMAMDHMTMAKDSMAKNDMAGCKMHMNEAMGMMKK